MENEFQSKPIFRKLKYIFRGPISSGREKQQLGLSRTTSQPNVQLSRSGSNPVDKTQRFSASEERVLRATSNPSDATKSSHEFLSCLPSRITQPGARKTIRLCCLLSGISFMFVTSCMGGLAVYLHPIWWLCVVAWIFAGIPAVFGYATSITGNVMCLSSTTVSNLLNVFVAIAVVCVVMTDVSNARVSANECKRKATEGVACGSVFSIDQLDYLSDHRAIVTAIVTLDGIVSVICNGTSMVYSFFLVRKCRRQSRNWLTSKPVKRPPNRTLTTHLSNVNINVV